METLAQTLVLVDNSMSVSKVNREITRQTLKYLFTHSGKGRAYCFTPFSHTLDYAESYTDDYVGLEDMADRIKYENKEASLTDVLSGVLDKWEQGDFACRDILIFTDGLEEKSQLYQREELFYLLEHNSYPVYIVCLDQNNNAEAVKNLSAICRVSEGKLFHTEFEGSDAEVEIKLTNQIFEAMDSYSQKNWAIYEENEAESESEGEAIVENEENHDAEDSITGVIETEYEDISYLGAGNQEDIIYESYKTGIDFNPITYAAFGGILFIVICGIFLSWCLLVKHKKKVRLEEEEYRKRLLKKVEEKRSAAFSSYEETITGDGETVSLLRRDNDDFDEGRTRLLYEEAAHKCISFEDVSDPSKYFKVTNRNKIILGRNEKVCDVVFDYDDSVSARHCEISFEDGSYYLRDLNSSNGTSVNGEEVRQKKKISSNDMIKLGLLSVIVRFE